MSLRNGLTFRHVQWKEDSAYRAEYMAAYEAFTSSPMRKIVQTKKSLRPGMMDRFIWDNVPGDAKSTYFLAKDSFYSLKKLNQTECSWWPLYLSSVMNDRKGISPEEMLEQTLYIYRYIKEREIVYSSYVILFGWFMMEKKPVPLALLQKLAAEHGLIYGLIMDELYFRFEDTGDIEDFISSFEELHEPFIPVSSRNFLEYYLRGHIHDDIFSERIMPEDSIRKFEVPEKPVRKRSYYYGILYEEEYSEALREWEFRTRWKTMADNLGVTEHTVIFSPGTALAGCVIIPEKSLSLKWSVLTAGISGFISGPFSTLWNTGGCLPSFMLDTYLYGEAVQAVGGWLVEGGGRMTLPMRKEKFIPEEWTGDGPLYTVVTPPENGKLPFFARRASLTECQTMLGQRMNDRELRDALETYDRLGDPYRVHSSDPDTVFRAICAKCMTFADRRDAEGTVSFLIDLSLDIDPPSGDSYNARELRALKHVYNTSIEAISSLWMVPVDWSEDPGLLTPESASHISMLYSLYPGEKRPFSLMEPVLRTKMKTSELRPYTNKRSTAAPLLVSGVDSLMKEHADISFSDAVWKCFHAVEQMDGRDASGFLSLSEEDREMVIIAISGSDAGDASGWQAGSLVNWEPWDFSSACPVPERLSIKDGAVNLAQGCFRKNMERLSSLPAGNTSRNAELNWKGGLSDSTDQELRGYLKWRNSFLSGKAGIPGNESFVIALFMEMTYAPDEMKKKAVSVMMRLASLSSSVADALFVYLLKNRLPIPAELLRHAEEHVDGISAIVLNFLHDRKISFASLCTFAPRIDSYRGPVRSAMEHVLPVAWRALYGDHLGGEESEGRSTADFTAECCIPASSLSDTSVSFTVPYLGSTKALRERIESLWNALHAVITDITVTGIPHPVEGFTENECFLMRKTVWDTLFVPPAARRRFFPGWKMPKDPIWPFELGAGKKNAMGVRSVYAGYFVSSDSLRSVPAAGGDPFFRAAEEGAMYDGLLMGAEGDEGIARAVLSRGNGPEELNGELAWRFFSPGCGSAVSRKEPELIRSALSAVLYAYIGLGKKRRNCCFDSPSYVFGRLGMSDIMGWQLEFQKTEGLPVVLNMAENAVLRLRERKHADPFFPSGYEWVSDILDDWVKAGGRNPHVKERIELSEKVLKDIRKDSDSVREALRTEEDEEAEITAPVPEITVPDCGEGAGDLLSMLDSAEKAVLSAMVRGEDPEAAAEANFTLVEVVVDSVNTKALDVYGEALLDEDGTPYPEWAEELERLCGAEE